jgi:predicted metal-dependent phosphoesterase TrpH
VIDLHLHTTASDGRSTPEMLVRELAAAGITICAVTDHDTVASIDEVSSLAGPAGIRVVPGIEITAVADDEDVHMLGYFFDYTNAALTAFLETQRSDRRRRLDEMAARLEAIGVPVDVEAELAAKGRVRGKAVGRPLLAAALVRAGHVATMAEAFEKYLGNGCPAFMPRRGASPAEVVSLVHKAGGIASIAHPGKLKNDALIEPLVDAGLDAIEVFHPDHDAIATAAYRARATRLGVIVSGGSDYHGADSGRVNSLGRVSLPADAFATLEQRAAQPRA